MRNYLATLNYWSHLPINTVYRGAGKFDFYEEETQPIKLQIMKEKLVELKEDATLVYRKSGEKTKISAEIKKEGKPIAKNEDTVKVKK